MTLDDFGEDRGDTIYMTAADGQGNVDLAHPVAVRRISAPASSPARPASRCTIAARGFNLVAGHPNQIGPHKRPLHTLVPAMMLKDGKP